jgi:hypothetical protein
MMYLFGLEVNMKLKQQKKITTLFIGFYAIFLTGVNVFAQDVYKWKDQDGKTHYGDRLSSDKSFQKVEVKLPKKNTAFVSSTQLPSSDFTSFPKPAKLPDHILNPPPELSIKPILDQRSRLSNMPARDEQPEIKMVLPPPTPENEKLLAMGEPALQKCVDLSRSMSNAEGGQEKAFRLEFLDACRGIVIKCKAFKTKPEKNQCVPLPSPAKGPIRVYDWTN